MKYLLDVNILLAAIWTSHTRHPVALSWLSGKEVVLCPITELGFLRISANKRALGVEMQQAKRSLEKFASDLGAEWIACDLPSKDSHPQTSDQVTDYYLADLAARYHLKLAMLDGNLSHSSVELVD